jgi:hypothetical protein
VRGCARARVVVDVVDADRLGCLAQLARLDGGIALGLDLCLPFTVGSLGLLEDVDNVFALCW